MSRIADAAPAGLVRTLTVRLVITTILVMLLQAGIVAVRDYLNETDFHNTYVRREAQQIARWFSAQHADAVANTSGNEHPSYFSGPNAAAYGFRIVDGEGRLLAEQNGYHLQALDRRASCRERVC